MTSLLILCLSLSGTLDGIAAIVGDTPILRSDVSAYLEESGMLEAGDAPDSSLFEEGLQALVNERILVEAARQVGYYPAETTIAELVDARVVEMRSGFEDEQAFTEALAEAGLTLQALQERLSDVLGDRRAAQDFVQSHVSLGSLPADPVSYLEGNGEYLESQLMPRHLGWILLPVVPSGPDAAEALALLASLRERIAAGESFEDLAREYSDDPGSAGSGGQLGYFAPGDMTAAFEWALQTLRPGQLSQPFLSPYGAHLARLDSGAPGDTMSASHILLRLDTTPGDLAVAMAMADSVADLISSGRYDFADAAAIFSRDAGTASRGGDLGMVLVRRVMPEAAAAIAELDPGETGRAVAVQEGTGGALFSILGGEAEIDWRGYDGAWLQELVTSIEYEKQVDALVDSLRTSFPVVRR
jgi:peptidyl-prolyl cis-trans isomerase SurA